MNKSTLKIFLLVLLVVLLLLPLHWLPEITIAGYEIKRISIVSDVVPEKYDTVTDSFSELSLPAVPSPSLRQGKKQAALPDGLIPILDYDDGTGHGMTPFYEALNQRHSLGRPVRIAYLGDSFIEADLMTASLRDQLQHKFGGNGVGYVDMAPPYAAMRSTLRQRYGGWKESCILNKGTFSRRFLNISQRYYATDSIAWTEVCGVSLPGLDSTNVHTLYLCSSFPHTVSLKLDEGPMLNLQSQGNGMVEALSYKETSHKARWQVSSGNDVKYFGVAEESQQGVVLDNLSLRGSSGIQLNLLSESNMRQWNNVRPYDLIVLQYGLNVANKNQTDYAYYATQMGKVIERIKKAFPNTGILIVGVGDRGSRNNNGDISTMPGIVELSHYQQKLAADSHVAFWNLYDAMGGKGAMKRMAEAKPAEAAKDYTHITKIGGKKVSTFLFQSLVYGYEQFK